MPKALGAAFASVVILVVVATPISLVVAGTWMAAAQHRRMTTYVPAPCEIIESRVATSRTSKGGTKYRPRISYRYDSPAGPRVGSEVLPGSATAWTRRQAEACVAQYSVGSATECYVDPADPGRSFLIREYQFPPYLLVMIGGAVLMLVAGGAASWIGRPDAKGQPAEAGDTPVRLVSSSPLNFRVRGWLAAFVAALAGSAAPLHYFAVAEAPYSVLGMVATVVWGFFVLVPGVMLTRSKMLTSRVAEPIVSVWPTPLVVGRPFTVRVELPIGGTIRSAGLVVGLLATDAVNERKGGKSRTVTTSLCERWLEPAPIAEAGRGDVVRLDAELEAPADQPASTDPDSEDDRQVRWALRVRLEAPRSPDYTGEFPVMIRAPEGAEPPPERTENLDS
ncbi:MAG: DUF3592 domain-containing protein [Phycisphaerales bacterium]|nr:DUF3592 domain-containing protein [Phycisphaerales bacterium]